MDDALIIEIWDTFKDYISEKNREGAAIQFITFLDSKEIDIDALEGFDHNLDYAIAQVRSDDGYDDEDDEDYDDYDYDSDED